MTYTYSIVFTGGDGRVYQGTTDERAKFDGWIASCRNSRCPMIVTQYIASGKTYPWYMLTLTPNGDYNVRAWG